MDCTTQRVYSNYSTHETSNVGTQVLRIYNSQPSDAKGDVKNYS